VGTFPEIGVRRHPTRKHFKKVAHRDSYMANCRFDSACIHQLDIVNQSPYFDIHMTYIQIPEKHDAEGFLLLAKSGAPLTCLPDNIYGVTPEHIKLLKRRKIPFKTLSAKRVRLPKSSLAA
jgi:hypothetical protein